MTHSLGDLRAGQRQLRWVCIDKPYIFDGPDGQKTLADLFDEATPRDGSDGHQPGLRLLIGRGTSGFDHA